ncbi:hypothetical protein RMATCC62417_11568 [Rhizopus microsporus]|nr:hypothetical protein RMATCC62417_11568 [Rhizopus microsporus]
MCASQSIYRGVGRVVWGTSIPGINKSGREQIMIRMEQVIQSAKLGANRPNSKVPTVTGGILEDECDKAFWCASEDARNEKYYQKMAADGHLDYIKERESKFICNKEHDEL